MSSHPDVDVVVIGFGVAGAAAARTAAERGASVLVIDSDAPRVRRRMTSAAHGRPASGSRLGLPWIPRARARYEARAAALAAGARVHPRAWACELVVDGHRVVSVGYVALRSGSAEAFAYSCLSWIPRCLGRTGMLGPAVDERVDALWREASLVESVPCSSVILAIDLPHWDFVGPALWATSRAATRRGPVSSARNAFLSIIPELSPERDLGELRTAGRDSVTRLDGASDQRITPYLRHADRAVLTCDGLEVSGLYAAVPDERPSPAVAGGSVADPAPANAGEHAGRAAAAFVRGASARIVRAV